MRKKVGDAETSQRLVSALLPGCRRQGISQTAGRNPLAGCEIKLMSPNEQFKVTGWSRTEPSISVITGLPISIRNRSSEGVVYQVLFHSCKYVLVGLDLIRKRLESHHIEVCGTKGVCGRSLDEKKRKVAGETDRMAVLWRPPGFRQP